MQDLTQNYRLGARLIHWFMAVLVIAMIPVGFLMLNDELSRSLRNTLFILHKNTGALLLLLIALRLLYRWRNPPRLQPVQMNGLQEFAAKATHLALYALLIIMPVSGYVRVRAGGFPIEALDAIGLPPLVPRSDALAEAAQTVHLFGSYAIAALILAHVGAAALHGLVLRDGIFSRMWPIFSTTAR